MDDGVEWMDTKKFQEKIVFGFLPESSACAFGWAKLSFMPNFKFSNP